MEGDTIMVGKGEYKENINFKGKAITLKSVNGAKETIINGSKKGAVVTFNSQESSLSVIDGFSIINGSGTSRYSDWTYGGGIDCYNSSSPIIKNCLIYDNTATGYGGGICCWYSSSPTIVNCKIYDNNTTVWGGGGLYCVRASPALVNCIITKNTANGLGGGIFYNLSSPTIINCTISGNNASIGGGIYGENESSAIITNCIVWGNTAQKKGDEIWGRNESTTAIVTYCDVQGGYNGDGNIGGHKVHDPFFVDPENNDYHLRAQSPCIDAGTASEAPSYDIDGDVRPEGIGVDIGADELIMQTLDSDDII